MVTPGPPITASQNAKFGPSLAVEDGMHNLNREAAKEHELAAKSHRTAAEHNEKGENPTGNWHAERALNHSDKAYELAQKAANKSGQIGTL